MTDLESSSGVSLTVESELLKVRSNSVLKSESLFLETVSRVWSLSICHGGIYVNKLIVKVTRSLEFLK